MHFQISPITKEDNKLVGSFIAARWGSPMSVSRGRLFDTTNLPGFLCKEDHEVIGLVTYHIEGQECEIVTLNSQQSNRGLATQLLALVVDAAKKAGCQRVWLITTNDNTKAIRFYQRRGFEWVGFYRNSMDTSRKIKPEIAQTGDDDIPIKHEIEFELQL